jgi:hypothetical protein
MSLKTLRAKVYLRPRKARVEGRKKSVRRARRHNLERSMILQRGERGHQIAGVAVLEPVHSINEPRTIQLSGKPEPLIVLGPPDLRIRKLNERVHPIDVAPRKVSTILKRTSHSYASTYPDFPATSRSSQDRSPKLWAYTNRTVRGAIGYRLGAVVGHYARPVSTIAHSRINLALTLN